MNARIRRLIAGVAAPAILLGSVSCGKVARTGRSPAFLVIDALAATSGAQPGTFGGTLNSDVVTLVKVTVNGVETTVPTIFDDAGRVTLRAQLKDAGNLNAAAPSALNAVTVTRYRVVFIRADGHNIQGVDVPYSFDGGMTATVTNGPSDLGFEIVRHSAKVEAPLKALANLGGQKFLSTIAQVTFYGRDLTGNEVEATGSISINFADFGDPS